MGFPSECENSFFFSVCEKLLTSIWKKRLLYKWNFPQNVKIHFRNLCAKNDLRANIIIENICSSQHNFIIIYNKTNL